MIIYTLKMGYTRVSWWWVGILLLDNIVIICINFKRIECIYIEYYIICLLKIIRITCWFEGQQFLFSNLHIFKLYKLFYTLFLLVYYSFVVLYIYYKFITQVQNIYNTIQQQQHLLVWVMLSRGLGRSSYRQPYLYQYSYP